MAHYDQNNPSAGQTGMQNEQEDKSSGFVGSLKEQGKEQLEAQKRSVADQARALAYVVERATEELDRSDLRSIASYTGQLASKIKAFADGLRSRSIEDIVDDTRHLARRKPEMFFFGAIGAGIILSRFFKASQRKQLEHGDERAYSTAWGDVAPAHGRSASTTTADNLAGGA